MHLATRNADDVLARCLIVDRLSTIVITQPVMPSGRRRAHMLFIVESPLATKAIETKQTVMVCFFELVSNIPPSFVRL